MLKLLSSVTSFLSEVVDRILVVVLICFLIIGGYSLWDNYQIYNAANDKNLLRYKPQLSPSGDNNFEFTLDSIREINDEVIGWLTVDDTYIDYPITQCANNVKYVNTSVFNEYSLSGNPFLDCTNSSDFSDIYNIIYGHHMDANAMFGGLDKFMDQSYFEAHQTGILYTLDKVYKIRWFAAVRTDANDAILYFPQKEHDAETFNTIYDRIEQTAVCFDDIDITKEDCIVSLSTCHEVETNGRLLLYGILQDF